MRVLLVVHRFAADEAAGVQLYVRSLAHALVAGGHTVSVLCAGDPGSERVERDADGDVGVSRVPPASRDPETIRLGTPGGPVEAAFLEELDRFRPDVVHVHHLLFLSTTLVSAARRAGVPVVVSLSDFWFLCPLIHLGAETSHPLRGRLWGLSCFAHTELTALRPALSLVRRKALLARLRRHLARPETMRAELAAADAVLAPSEFVRRKFLAFGVASHAIATMPYGLPRSLPRRPPRTEGRSTRIGYLGAIIESKGVGSLVSTFSALHAPDARLTICGPVHDPALLARMEAAAAGDGRIEIRAPVADHDIGSYLAELDLLVVPTRLHETFSIVTREALAVGVPVLASDLGALPEVVVPGRNGDLFRAGSDDDLRAKLSRLVLEPGALERLRDFPRPKTMAEHAGELAVLYAALPERRSANARAR